MYVIRYHKKVIKFIKKRVPKEKERILQRLEELKKNPYPTNEHIDIKKLQAKNGYRLRIGDYRFLYDVEDKALIIYMEDADNRGDVY
ncbi:MAG: type II toxin-antitoxin system RelE/ParE family toxin [Campylobacterota bacterium]|nr:type II toxin-antitoxin system RelE/ParE family toxin [Campylobacterota bacterium]